MTKEERAKVPQSYDIGIFIEQAVWFTQHGLLQEGTLSTVMLDVGYGLLKPGPPAQPVEHLRHDAVCTPGGFIVCGDHK